MDVAAKELEQSIDASVARQVLGEDVCGILGALDLPEVDPSTADLVLEPQALRVNVAELS